MRASKVSDFTNKKNLILIVLTCILFLFVIGLIYYLVEEKALKEEKYKELSTIAKIKLEQITDWREERVYEAEFFAKGWNGEPVLNETTCGKTSVTNIGCQVCPNNNPVFSQLRVT